MDSYPFMCYIKELRSNLILNFIFLSAFVFMITADTDAQAITLNQSATELNPLTGDSFEFVHTISCSGTTAPCINIVLRDTLPDRVTFLNFSSPLPDGVVSATYDEVSREALITFDNVIPSGTTIQLSIQVKFPDGSINGSPALNTAYASSSNAGTDSSSVLVTSGDGVTEGIFPAEKSGDSEQISGGYQFWQIRVGNLGFTTIDNYSVIDTIPDELTFDQVRTPEFMGVDHLGELYYQRSDMPGTWFLWIGFNMNTRERRFVSELGLPLGVKVTILRLDLGSVPGTGFFNPHIYPETFKSRWVIYGIETSGLVEGDNFENCANYFGEVVGVEMSDEDCLTTDILPPSNHIEGSLVLTDTSLDRQSTFTIGDTMNADILIASPHTNNTDIIGGVMTVVLPPNVSYVDDSWNIIGGHSNLDFQIPIVEVESWINGRESVRFVFDSLFSNSFTLEATPDYRSFSIGFSTYIEPGASEGDYTVEYYFNSTQSIHDNCDIEDVNGYLRGFNSNYCSDIDLVNFVLPPGAAGLQSSMEVIGTLDNTYSKYPDQALTVPGGISDYRISIKNPNEVSVSDLVFITVLPHVGDTEVLDNSTPRFSSWQPALAAPLTSLPSGLTVEYSTVFNPCRNELAGTNPLPFPSGCNPPAWSSTSPLDITDVTALRFDYGTTIIEQNDSLVVSFAMRSPVDALPDTSIAWNSFAFRATNVEDDIDLLPAEPIKVGIELRPGNRPILGDFVWEDTEPNGRQDAHEVGIDGVRVELFHDVNNNDIAEPFGPDTLALWTITSGGGRYLFSDFNFGNYFIRFSGLPAGYQPTYQDLAEDSIDSDGLISEVIICDNTVEDYSIDLGLFNGVLPPLCISAVTNPHILYYRSNR